MGYNNDPNRTRFFILQILFYTEEKQSINDKINEFINKFDISR